MTTLGSCIAACLWDRERRIGGMNHFMLPDGGSAGTADSPLRLVRDGTADQRGCSSAAPRADDGGQGVRRRRGDLGMNSINVGERNTAFVLDYLRTERITVVSKDVPDIYPRRCASCRPAARRWSSACSSPTTDVLAAQERAMQQCVPGQAPAARWTCSEESRPMEEDPRGGGRRLGPGAQPAPRSSTASRHDLRRRRQPTRWWRAR